jgi:hypothetical protein
VNQLERALEWAARGFHVFPLLEGSKVPLGGSLGHLEATRDPAQIDRMWRDAMGFLQDYNIGFSPRDGNIVIADLDVKEGRHGIADYLALGGEIGGLVVRTPTRGLHVYLTGEDIVTGAGQHRGRRAVRDRQRRAYAARAAVHPRTPGHPSRA